MELSFLERQKIIMSQHEKIYTMFKESKSRPCFEFVNNRGSVSVTNSIMKSWKWIITYPNGEPIYECPCCHASNSSVFKNYCPNYGAEMEK